MSQDDLSRSITAAVQRGFARSVAELEALVRIPSVSWPAFDQAHVRASAEAVADLVRETGIFDTVEVRQEREVGSDELGRPAVLAHRPAKPGKPTVLLYAHHDVQPPGDDALWNTPPFEPTRVGDRLYGRGASDDKAGVISHLAAIRAVTEVVGELDMGVSLFIEGEEEWASKSFGNFLREHADVLEADAIIVADSDNWDTETPALTVALRGAAAFNLTIETLDRASHSGMYGGAVPDAMLAAVKLLATLWNDAGEVAVAGMREADLTTPEYTEAQLRQDTGLLDGVTPIGSGSLLSRIWAKPSISITGIDATDVPNASNTLIPKVRVRLSARVAPGQDAAEAGDALMAHLREHAPFGAKLNFEDPDVGQPFLVDSSGWAAQEMRAAMADAWGREPVDVGVGGSIPFIADLAEKFPDAQVLVTGVEDPDTRAHSPNESQHLGVLEKAMLTEALFLARMNAR